MSRQRTISKEFYDDEIIGKLDNGDLYLQMGVKRKYYDKSDNDLTSESDSQINYFLLANIKNKESMKRYKDVDPNEDTDNWETE